MVKRRREADSDGANIVTEDDRTVFIDTSLDTHLAVVVSKSDTVSDVKRKIVLEHMHCFPLIGEIHIDSLKVKRRTIFYHLPDLMPVWNAFQGANTSWFLSADASGTPSHQLNQNSLQLGTSDGVKMGVKNIDDNTCRGLSSVVNMFQTLPMPLPDGVSEKNLASEMIPVCEVNKSLENAAEIQSNNYSEENCMGTESRAKKKRKIRHTEDVCHSPILKDRPALARLSGNDTSLPETVGGGNSTVDAVKEATGSIVLYQEHGKHNTPNATDEVSDQRDIENGFGLEGKSALPETVGSGISTVDVVKEATWSLILYQQQGEANTSNATDEVSGVRNDQCDIENKFGLESKSALPETVGSGNLTVDAVKEATGDVILYQQNGKPNTSNATDEVPGVRNDQCDIENGVMLKDKSSPDTAEESHLGSAVNSQTILDSDTRKEDTLIEKTVPEDLMASKLEYELGLEVTMEHSGAVSVRVPDSSGAMGDVSSDGTKKKKKKAQKTAKNFQDNTDREQSTKDDSIKPCSETHQVDKKEDEKGLSLPLNSKASDYADLDLMPKEASLSSHFCDANAIVELDFSGAVVDVNSDGIKKKKKKAQKTAKKIQDNTDMEQTTKDDSIMPYTETLKADENEKETGSSLNYDREIATPLNNKASDHADPDLVPEEARPSPRVCHVNAIVEPDSSGAMGDIYSDGNKRMKKKARKAAKKLQDTTDMEQTTKDDSTKACTETREVDKEEEEKGLSLNLDHESIMPSNSKASDYADQDLMPESSFSTRFGDVNAIVQPEISSGGRKKKTKRKGTKSASTNIEKSSVEQTDNGGIGSLELLCPPTDPTPEEIREEESILHHKEMEVSMALLNSSTQDASEEVRGADRNEAEFLILTQTKEAVEDVDTGNKKAVGKNQLSAVEKDNSIVEFTEVEKDIKNSEGKIEKAKRKKKRKPTGSDVQENLPSKDQKVGIEALRTDGFENSEQKGGHEASSQVLSNKSEENLEAIHTAPVITDDPAKTSENGGVGVNFKQYFVTGPNEDKTDSGDKTAAMSNEEMRTSKNTGENGLPSINFSTDLQNSVKTVTSKGSEKKTRVTKDNGSRQGDPAQNPAKDEVVSNSSRRSSRAKTRVKEKNPSFDKSSSKKTETSPEKKENKRLHSGLSVTNKMMKTPKKKNLLTKPGAIFQDNSGESSGGDNEIVHLKANIGSPSDSSSESSDSVGKGDLNRNSTRNGSNDAEGRSTGQKSISKLDISASKGMTMDMILRSSKRFKKAKLNAHDNGYDSERQL